MFENIGKIYKHYGGVAAILKSSYFWISVFLAAMSYQSISNFAWAETAIAVLPSLTGFTIAAFAIIFAILDPEMLRKLMATDEDGRSPIAGIAASIGHAVFIQVAATILAISSGLVDLSGMIAIQAEWLNSLGCSPNAFLTMVEWIVLTFSAVGLLFTYYGVALVLAAILTIVRMQLIVAGAVRAGRSSPNRSQQQTGSSHKSKAK